MDVVNSKVNAAKESWAASYDAIQAGAYSPTQLGRNFGPWSEMGRPASDAVTQWDSGCDVNLVRWILARSVETPPGFELHQQLHRHVQQRLAMAQSGEKIDFGGAEAAAFGSLLHQGFSVRIAGQEAGRATFAHRHAILTEQESERQITPLADLGDFEPVNAPLTEQAVVAYEWGYAADHPRRLVLWEAQFGDFWNQAEVSVDTLLTCGEAKWGLQGTRVFLILTQLTKSEIRFLFHKLIVLAYQISPSPSLTSTVIFNFEIAS